MQEWVQEKILERGPGLEMLVCDLAGAAGRGQGR